MTARHLPYKPAVILRVGDGRAAMRDVKVKRSGLTPRSSGALAYAELPEPTDDMLARDKVSKGGRPRSENSGQLISIRLPEYLIQRWRATGRGWQTRVSEELLQVVPQ